MARGTYWIGLVAFGVLSGFATACSDACSSNCAETDTNQLKPGETTAPSGEEASSQSNDANATPAPDETSSGIGGAPNVAPTSQGAAEASGGETNTARGGSLNGEPAVGGRSAELESPGGAGGLEGVGEVSMSPPDAGPTDIGSGGGFAGAEATGGSAGAEMADAGAEAFVCAPEEATESCEACVQERCCEGRLACSSDVQCEAEWATFKTCMAEKDLASNPGEDAVSTIQDCLAEASPDGSDLGVTDAMFELTTCIGTAVEDGDEERLPGDGQCTFPCYGVDTLEQFGFEDDLAP
jgi:hypothetical protein